MKNIQSIQHIRDQFELDDDLVHFATMVFASHPDPVRRAIKNNRIALNRQSVTYFSRHSMPSRVRVLNALSRYFDVKVGLGTVTHSTTVGLAQVLGGFRMSKADEFLISNAEHAATVETLKLRHRRDGTACRQFPLCRDVTAATPEEICDSVRNAIRTYPAARVLALAWVYSSTGLKLPIRETANIVREENLARKGQGREPIWFVVDGVHGFGIENTTFVELDCDFFIAGTHKSIFGPRGTAIIAGKKDAWEQIDPLIPTLSGASEGPASAHTPGGVRAHEHWWALAEAFDFHLDELGKTEVQQHVHDLATELKERLRIDGVRVVTPPRPEMSSGIVCFDVRGFDADQVVDYLEPRGIIASESSPDPQTEISHARLSVSVLNSRSDVECLIKALKELLAQDH